MIQKLLCLIGFHIIKYHQLNEDIIKYCQKCRYTRTWNYKHDWLSDGQINYLKNKHKKKSRVV